MAEGDLSGSITTDVLWRPSTAEVAAKIPDRVGDDAGNPLEDFTTTTEPTAQQVEEQIDEAVREIALAVGVTLEDDDLVDSARVLAARRAAQLVEMTFFRQQVASGQSTFEQMDAMFDKGLAALVKAVTEYSAGGEPGAVDDYVPPAFCFPPPAPIGGDGW
jgi:hypothetical protein